jgi:hypothetical protein
MRPLAPGGSATASSASTSHLFILGLPRTGSTLTRGIVNASPDVWVAGESHYLPQPTRLGLGRREGYLARFSRLGDLTTSDGLDRVVRDIFSLRGKNFWARLGTRTDADHFRTLLATTERAPRDLLDVAMAVFADGRPIRGEKTPHHIEHVPTLLSWYPAARVVHTFRDPRAVYASLRYKERDEKLTTLGRAARRLGSWFDRYATLNLARTWRRAAELHRSYEQRFPDRYLLVRFEDLVADPASEARRIADFVGVDFTPAMLEQVVHNSSYAAKGATAGIDPSVVDRWRSLLPEATRDRLTRLSGDDLEAFGYRAS